MQYWSGAGLGRTIFVRMDNGDDFLDSLQTALDAEGIRFGFVASGIATFKQCRLHQVLHCDYPPSEGFLELTEPLEVMSVDGLIAAGKPHLHCTIATKDGKAYGGHIEPGCIVLYLAEVCVVEATGVQMDRRRDETHAGNVYLLQPVR